MRRISRVRAKCRAPDYGTRLMPRLKLDRLSTPATLLGFSRRPDVRKGVRSLDVSTLFDTFPMPPCARTNPNKNKPLPPNSGMLK